MPLPADKTPLYTGNWERVYRQYAEDSAWYSGDPNRIAEVYAQMVYTPTDQGKFWAQEVKVERRTMLHVPLAGDIAATSANLLFSEPPKITIPDAHEENAPQDALDTQARLDTILLEGGFFQRLLEGAETGAALGGVFLVPVWDKNLAPYPLLQVNQADNALPEFQFGILKAVTFHKELDSDTGAVWRLVERHEMSGGKAHILTGLYKGSADNFGEQVPLTTRADTADLVDDINTGLDFLPVAYVPNMTPHNLWRGMPIGKSDFAGSYGMLDALDEVFTSWHRDIRLGKARLLVPADMLDFSGGKPTFEIDREVFSGLEMPPTEMEGGLAGMVSAHQFLIRMEEHKQTALEYIERIVSRAGYSPQTFGLKIEGQAESGTALQSRKEKSTITIGKKQEYWAPAIRRVVKAMLFYDRQHLGNGTNANFDVNVEMQEPVQTDLIQLANTVNTLKQAQSASTEMRVRMLRPSWTKEQVDAEVKRIMEEEGLSMPNPDEVGVM